MNQDYHAPVAAASNGNAKGNANLSVNGPNGGDTGKLTVNGSTGDGNLIVNGGDSSGTSHLTVNSPNGSNSDNLTVNDPNGNGNANLNEINWSIFRAAPPSGQSRVNFNVPVRVSLADECVAEYQRVYSVRFDPVAVQLAFTESIAFDGGLVNKWLADFRVFEQAKFLVLRLGIYTKNVVDTLNLDPNPANHVDPVHIGRLTAFVWPMIENALGRIIPHPTLDPFNIGSLHP